MSKKQASKVSRITSVLVKGVNAAFTAVYFRVGSVPLRLDGTTCLRADGTPAFPVVSDIKFCKYEFGTGALVKQPCYSIEFVDGLETMIIPADSFSQITLEVMEKSEPEDRLPGLPKGE